MIRNSISLVWLLLIASFASAQQTIVFPAVVDEVSGRNESVWETIARIIKVDPADTVTVRRKWVCLPGGGFLEDPANAPTWTLWAGDPRDRGLLLWGADLLVGTDAKAGAVAFEIEGGEVIAHSVVHDISRGVNLPPLFSFGQGQLPVALRLPVIGDSNLQWVGGCINSPCTFASQPEGSWDFLRNNIGIVSPNAEPITITGTVIPFSTNNGIFREIDDPQPETFAKTVPPYGWLQFNWVSDRYYGTDSWGVPIAPRGGFVISLTPDRDDVPYYAYASVVFTPDPDSDIPIFNDPMFVPAEPGYVAPFNEVFPSKGQE